MQRFGRPLIPAMLLLTACVPGEERSYRVMPAQESESAAKPPVVPEPPPPPPAARPLPERKPGTPTDPVGAAEGPDPKQLVGLGFRETEALLGTPTRQEERPPAKIWTYENSECILNIFFYADINTRQFRALTYEVKENHGTTTTSGGPADQCLSHLMRGT